VKGQGCSGAGTVMYCGEEGGLWLMQVSLERLCLPAGLGMVRDPPGETRKTEWGICAPHIATVALFLWVFKHFDFTSGCTIKLNKLPLLVGSKKEKTFLKLE